MLTSAQARRLSKASPSPGWTTDPWFSLWFTFAVLANGKQLLSYIAFPNRQTASMRHSFNLKVRLGLVKTLLPWWDDF